MQLKKIRFIAQYTFQEIYKSKILLNVFFVGLVVGLSTYVASEFTYGVPGRVAMDFGLGLLSLSSLGISLFLGVGLLTKEVESRTVYMVVSRPASRTTFIIGKLLGLIAIQVLNVTILSLMTVVMVKLIGGKLDPLLYWAMFFIFIESLMLLLVVVLMSLISNSVISVIFSVLLLLFGHAIRSTQEILIVKSNPVLFNFLKVYHFALPGFYKLNLKDFVIYNNDLPLPFLLSSLSYGVLYSLFLLGVITIIFNRKNLD